MLISELTKYANETCIWIDKILECILFTAVCGITISKFFGKLSLMQPLDGITMILGWSLAHSTFAMYVSRLSSYPPKPLISTKEFETLRGWEFLVCYIGNQIHNCFREFICFALNA